MTREVLEAVVGVVLDRHALDSGREKGISAESPWKYNRAGGASVDLSLAHRPRKGKATSPRCFYPPRHHRHPLSLGVVQRGSLSYRWSSSSSDLNLQPRIHRRKRRTRVQRSAGGGHLKGGKVASAPPPRVHHTWKEKDWNAQEMNCRYDEGLPRACVAALALVLSLNAFTRVDRARYAACRAVG